MISKIAIKRPVSTLMIVLMVVLAGVLSYMNLDLAYMPSIDYPVAMVSTTYTGVGPEEIEELVTKPLEEALATITGVDTITSVSSAGSSMIAIQFVDGTDLDMISLDIREKIDMVSGRLPDDANEPKVMKMDFNAETVSLGITSKKYDLEKLYAFLDTNVTTQLEKIEGVSAVEMMGGIENEVQITVNQEKLQGHGISINQIAGVLAKENVNAPAGSIKQGNASLQVRAIGEFKSVEEIANLPITTGNGTMIYIKDIATVEEVEKEQSSYAMINGTEGIMYSLSKQSDANIVNLTEAVKETITKLEKQYPDLEIELLSTTGDYIKDSVANVATTAFQSALVAIIVLLVILRDPKTSLVIAISIPTSIVATFALMYVKGMTLNTISMGGIVIGIGMLVDNSVVVLENIYKHFEKGLDPKKAAEVGTKEVSMAVLASTLTTVAVFLPLTFVSGMVGQMMHDLSYTICFALAASYVVAITVVPMACSLILKQTSNKKENALTRALDAWGRVLDGLDRGYKNILKLALKHRVGTLLVVLGIFSGTLAIVPLVGFDLMPITDEGAASISITLPDGSLIEDTKDILTKVLSKIEDIPEIEMTSASIQDSNTASVTIDLVAKQERTRSTDEVCDEIEKLMKNIAGADISVASSSAAMGVMAGGSNISLNIKADDSDTLRTVSEELVTLISQIKGATNVESSLNDSLTEANLIVNRAKAAKYGVSTSDIANTIYMSLTGTTATQYKTDGTEIDVVIKYDDERTNYIKDLENLTLTTGTGARIPVTEVAEIVMGESAVSINRENQRKYITITGNIEDVDTSVAQELLEEKLSQYIFPEGCTYSFGGTMEMMNEAFASLGIALIVAVLLVYMIMASQFESFSYPFIVMFSMPIAITGGIIGLFLVGETITVTAFMGFIMLVGMVVNNAIVLVDYTNQLIHDHGMECKEALLAAGPSRLRPILMTTLTTIIGLVPMALGTAEGMEIQKPLGITVIFGLTLSTLITLILIPVLYLILNNLKNRKKSRKEKVVNA